MITWSSPIIGCVGAATRLNQKAQRYVKSKHRFLFVIMRNSWNPHLSSSCLSKSKKFVTEVVREIYRHRRATRLHPPACSQICFFTNYTFCFISRLIKLSKFYRSLVSRSDIKVLSDHVYLSLRKQGLLSVTHSAPVWWRRYSAFAEIKRESVSMVICWSRSSYTKPEKTCSQEHHALSLIGPTLSGWFV